MQCTYIIYIYMTQTLRHINKISNTMEATPLHSNNLHHVWDRALFNNPELRINNDNGHAQRTFFSGHA